MSFARNLLLAGCMVALLAGLVPRTAAAQAMPRTAESQASAPAAPRQAYTLPPDKLAKAVALTRIRNILAIVLPIWELAVLWFLLSSRALARLEAWARRRTSRKFSRRWLQGVCFFVPFLLVVSLASLPFAVYAHHLSLAYGISVERWGAWLGDEAKSLALLLVIGTFVLLLFHWIVRRWPRRYWFAAWIVSIPLLLLSIFLEPLVIDPLFNKFEPLAKTNPALVTQLEKVVTRTGTEIPPDRMFLMKASEKTNGLNAYVTGIGASKRVVVWDTTAGRIPDGQILFIFAHESGHYVLHHIPKGIAASVFALFFIYWACAAFAAWLIRRLGARWGISSPQNAASPEPWQSSRTGFVALLFVVFLANFLMEPASNAFSRHYEHQADVYGQEAIHGIVADPQATAVAAFNSLGEAWLEAPNVNPFVEFWLYDHPDTQRRATFALHYNPWAKGGGEFFAK
jgi:STE24 endopeptidase